MTVAIAQSSLGKTPIPVHFLRSKWFWLCLLAGCLWSLLMLLPVMAHPGWPSNHDGTAPVMRMAAVLEQWRLGHVLPVWSTSQQFGHGSPLPALYHKTFMYTSAAVLALTGSVKAALVVSTWIWMVVGFCGICFCLRQLLQKRHPWLWLLGGALFLSSNYAFTDWLVRGAFAEFSAMAVLPWLFAGCLVLLMDGRWPVWIGAVLAVLVLSHSTLGAFALFPLVIAAVVAAWRWRRAAFGWIRPGIASAAVCAVLVAPFVLPMVAMGRFNRIEELVRHPRYTPMTNNLPGEIFFWNQDWIWGNEWTYITVQMDPVLLFLLPVFIGLCIARWRNAQWRSVGVFLLAVLSAMAWLQTRYAFSFYEYVPGAIYLQFTYRLLAYETVVLTSCACMALGAGIEHARRWRFFSMPGGRTAVGCVAIALLSLTAWPKVGRDSIRYEWMAAQRLHDDLKSDYLAMGEFFPLVDWPPLDDIQAVLRQTLDHTRSPGLKNCQVLQTDMAKPQERSRGHWQVGCPAASLVSLGVFAAPGMAVRVRPAGSQEWIKAPVVRTCSDPRLQVRLGEGVSEVQVVFPTWWLTVRTLLQKPAFDFRRDCALLPAASHIAGHRGMSSP